MNFIQAWRMFRSVPLGDLAAKVGMSAAALDRVERGQANHTQQLLRKLARELDCTPDDLLNRSPIPGLVPGQMPNFLGS